MSDASRRKAARAAARLRRLLKPEADLWGRGFRRVAGIDEAGVGPLAGPVVAAAVVFPEGKGLRGVDDSKKLSAPRRAELSAEIREAAVAWAVVRVDPPEIDAVNIYQAGRLAMKRAVERLSPVPDYLLVDGRAVLDTAIQQSSVIGGDARCHAIAAASILAKTERDRLMVDYDGQYPGYGFAAHKGYPTRAHRDAIRALGPTPIHRRSFTLLPHPRLFD